MLEKGQNFDNFEKTFKTFEEMVDFHTELSENSIWRKSKINSYYVYPIYEDEKNNDMFMCTPSEGVTEETLQETANTGTKIGLEAKLSPDYEGEGLFAEEVQPEEVVVYPLRDTAMRSILDRCKISGASLQKMERMTLAGVLNKCAALYEEDSLLLIRNEKITACHSNSYKILPIEELLKVTNEKLNSLFGAVTFVNGYTNHDFSTALFQIDGSQSLISSYVDKLDKAGYKYLAQNLVPAVRFSTSDTGVACAKVSAYLTGSSQPIAIGANLSLDHKGNSSVEEFGDRVQMLFAIYTKSVEKLEELMNIQIEYPINCMTRICRALKLPKKASLEAIAQFEMCNGNDDCTAHDIYIAMQEIAFIARTREKMSKVSLFSLEENLARALDINWNQYDTAKDVNW